jgi:hypothetical protein
MGVEQEENKNKNKKTKDKNIFFTAALKVM